MTAARTSPPAALIASASPCRVLFRESTVTVTAAPLPAWRVRVPVLILAFGSANPADAVWCAWARLPTVTA
jgi:hypothetical protein